MQPLEENNTHMYITNHITEHPCNVHVGMKSTPC